jgi:hypothetical protein
MEAGRAARVLGRACARGRPPCVGYRRRGGVSTVELEVVAGPAARAPVMTRSDRAAGCSAPGLQGSTSATRVHDVDDRPGARAFFRIGALGKMARALGRSSTMPLRAVDIASVDPAPSTTPPNILPIITARPRRGLQQPASHCRCAPAAAKPTQGGRPRAQAKPSTRVEPCVLDRGGSSSP